MGQRKRPEGDELLIVHGAAKAVDPGKSGLDRGPTAGARRVPALDKEELEVMKRRFAAARDPAEQRALLVEVQRKFGNEQAAALVKEAARKDDDLPVKLAGKAPGGKTK